MIYVTSDLHLCHNREFVYVPRGFTNVYDMNQAIVERWNAIVQPDDDVYVLGDLMLNDNTTGRKIICDLKGKLHIVPGNHDTDTRIEIYKTCWNVVEIDWAIRLKYCKHTFYMTHFPCMTANLEKESLRQCTCNLYGHTHQKSNFYQDIPFMYHVGMDSHSCTPVSLDQVIIDMYAKAEECKAQL